MATERIGTFVQVYVVDTNNQVKITRRYQNAALEKRIEFQGKKYDFLSFIYSGATISLTGDNVTAELTLSSNDIAKSKVAELVNQNYRADVSVCRMNGEFTEVKQILSQDTWLVSSATYDSTAIQIQLSSGLDAVNANTPRRVLTNSDVGPLPVTGRVRL